eukprot:scaffold5204_cov135-Cylindrotheca_fusiformis.AAC.1
MAETECQDNLIFLNKTFDRNKWQKPMEEISTFCWILASAGALITFLTMFFRRTKAVKEDESTKPFRIYNHPEKSFLDKLISWLFPRLLPLTKLTKYSPSANENKKLLEHIRSKGGNMDSYPFKQSCKMWKDALQSQKAEDNLVFGRVSIPRNSNVLQSKGLVPPPELDLKSPQDNGTEVSIELICPRLLIKSGIKVESGEDEYLCIQSSKLEDIVFAESTQLLLWFHGGGMVMGSAKEAHCVGNVAQLCQRDANEAPINIAVISVFYRLAPENPFPAAIIDGLSVCDFLIQNFPKLPLHIGGISAGGNLAAVIGLEAYRSFPGKVKSMLVDAPMVQPRTADSKSYYLQSKSSGVCPIAFMHWVWAAYLQLDQETIDYRSRNGFQKALDRSKWSSLDGYGGSNGGRKEAKDDSMFWRLVSPQVDVPTLNANDAPKILICTATADPLHDDGVELVEALRKKNMVKIHHFDFKGSHAMAQFFDPEGKAAMINEWSKSFDKVPSTENPQ